MQYLNAQKNTDSSSLSPWLNFVSCCKSIGHFSVIIVLALGLISCGGADDADLRQFVSEAKAKKKSRIPPLPEPQTFEIFAYDDASLRDPFIPAQIQEAASSDSGLRPDTTREKEVLEEFALGSLKMMGSLEKGGRRWALLRAADGTLHRTTIGRHMGQNNGEILRITENELELKEIVPDGMGGWIERFSTLTASE